MKCDRTRPRTFSLLFVKITFAARSELIELLRRQAALAPDTNSPETDEELLPETSDNRSNFIAARLSRNGEPGQIYPESGLIQRRPPQFVFSGAPPQRFCLQIISFGAQIIRHQWLIKRCGRFQLLVVEAVVLWMCARRKVSGVGFLIGFKDNYFHICRKILTTVRFMGRNFNFF